MRVRPSSLLLLSVLLLAGTIFFYLSDGLQWGLGGEHEHNLGLRPSAGKEDPMQEVFPRRSNLAVELHEGRGREGAVQDSGAPREFRIVQPFSFPQPTFSRPAAVLLRARWVVDLQDYLRTSQGNAISVVTSTIEHREVLLNWLIAAYVKLADPLRDVMVISMDAQLHSLLASRGIPSLYVHKDMVVRPEADVSKVFSQVHVVRLAVVRLMNHYGYDVINYDCDAVPLRNPQPIFDEFSSTDLIGTFGKGPTVLYDRWGVTLNTGVMVMRATPNMGKCVCVSMSLLAKRYQEVMKREEYPTPT